MLDGWYCRTLASQQTSQNDENEDDNEPNVVDESDDSQDDVPDARMPNIDYKTQYVALKKKLKFLLYENEFFQDALRSSQRRLLKVTRDRSFLLDRLLQYEKPENTESESDDTDLSEQEAQRPEPAAKKRKNEAGQQTKKATKRKKAAQKEANDSGNLLNANASNSDMDNMAAMPNFVDGILNDGHMPTDELARHLRARQSLMDFVPEASDTVPAEMFSHEQSLDSECNDHLIDGADNLMGDDSRNFMLNHSHD